MNACCARCRRRRLGGAYSTGPAAACGEWSTRSACCPPSLRAISARPQLAYRSDFETGAREVHWNPVIGRRKHDIERRSSQRPWALTAKSRFFGWLERTDAGGTKINNGACRLPQRVDVTGFLLVFSAPRSAHTIDRADRQRDDRKSKQYPPLHRLCPPGPRLGTALEPAYGRREGRQNCFGDGAVSCFGQMIQIVIDRVLPIVKERGQIDCIHGIDQFGMTPPLPDYRLIEEHPPAGIAGIVIGPATLIGGFEPLGRDHGLPEE